MVKSGKAPVETPLGSSPSRKKQNALNEISPNVSASGFSPFSNTQGSMKKKGSDNDLYHESLEEKKERLFKWNAFQTIKFPQDMIKDTLIQNINILRFLNLFESFDTTLFAWGSNDSLLLGLCLKRDL